MSVNDIKANIEKLEKSINSPTTPESFLPKLKGKKMELEAELKKLESAEKKEDNLEKILENTDKILKSKTASKTVKNTAKKKAQTAKKEIAKVKQVKETVAKKASTTKVNVKELLAGLSKDQKAFNRGRSKDEIQTDARVKALPAGKRISADGNVYYENRPNRSDVSTKRKPYLEDGGEVDLTGDVYKVLYTKKDGDETVYWEEIYAESEKDAEDIFNKKHEGKNRTIENISNRFAKGGKLSNKGAYLNEPQGGKYTRYEDSKESNRAKPAGWRYTNAGAKRLKLSNPNTYVTKAHLEKYRGKYFTDSKGVKHRYVYIERRADKSDIKRGFPFLEKGGELEIEKHNEKEDKVTRYAVKHNGKTQGYINYDIEEGVYQATDNSKNSGVRFALKEFDSLDEAKEYIDSKLPKKVYMEYAKGGSIPNNYEGKTAEQVWDEWSVEQREHFLQDHNNQLSQQHRIKKEKLEEVKEYKFNELGMMPISWLEKHISQGQYEHGGEIDNMDIAENSALKVYVKPTKKEGIALFKQGEAVCVCHDDDTHEWHDEKDLLKMEDGEILSEIAEDKLEGTNINIFGYQTQNFDVSEHAAQYFNEGIAKIEELGSESAKESLSKAAEQLDIILSKVKEKEEDELVLKSSTRVILNAIQLFAYNNYKCGLVIPIELLTNICSEILELDVDSEMVFEKGGTVENDYNKIIFLYDVDEDEKGEKMRLVAQGVYSKERLEKFSKRAKDKTFEYTDKGEYLHRQEVYIAPKNARTPYDNKYKISFEKGGEIYSKGGSISDKFEVGTPAVYHSLDYRDNPKEESGEIIIRDGVKGILLYPNKNYGGSNRNFIVPNWYNLETFYESNERQEKNIPFVIKNNKMYGKGGELKEYNAYGNSFLVAENGVVKKVKDYYKNNIIKEVDIKGKKYKFNSTYNTYNDSENKTLLLSDLGSDIDLPFEEGGEMKWGGRTTFNEKVSAITDSLDGNKVKPKYQKQYGKTYDRKEARAAAQKIVGKLMSNENKKKTTK
jgi:hypothetical protein